MLRVSEAKPLSILEQAKLVEALQGACHLSLTDIARLLDKSKAWVSVRSGMIREISPTVMNRVFSGQFPLYAYMYILRPFMRINGVKTKDIDEFVDLVSGRNLSIRDLKLLAGGYFKGSEEYRRQIKKGSISWVLSSLKETSPRADAVSSSEQALIKDLELTLKYMQRINLGSKNDGYKSNDFLAQANLLAGAILRQMDNFKEAVEEIHDKSGKRKAIYYLYTQGLPIGKIGKELRVDRKTVARIIKEKGELPDTVRSDVIDLAPELLRRLYSECKGYIQRVHEKLEEEHGVTIGYSTLTRKVRELGLGQPKNQRCDQVPDEPGKEMQHDTTVYKIKLDEKNVRLVASLLYFRYSKSRYLKFYLYFNRFKMKGFFSRSTDALWL